MGQRRKEGRKDAAIPALQYSLFKFTLTLADLGFDLGSSARILKSTLVKQSYKSQVNALGFRAYLEPSDSQNFHWNVRANLRKLCYLQMCVETKEQYQVLSDEELLQVEFYLRNGRFQRGGRLSCAIS